MTGRWAWTRSPWAKGVGLAALLAAVALMAPASGVVNADSSGTPVPISAVAAPKTITVTGQSQQQVAPDEAEINVGVQEHASSASIAQKQTNQLAEAVIKAAESLGVKAADIQTVNYNISPHYTPGQNSHVDGFQVEHTLHLTVRDIDSLGKVLDAVVAAGANQVYGITFEASNADQIQQQGYAAAVKDARAKADAMAQALGLHVTGVRSVSVGQSPSGPKPIFGAVRESAAAVPIQPGQESVATTVSVTFTMGQ